MASLAANTRWSRVSDRTAATAKARQAANDRFSKLVDPEETLDPEIRQRMTENARRAHYIRAAKLMHEGRRRAKIAREKKST